MIDAFFYAPTPAFPILTLEQNDLLLHHVSIGIHSVAAVLTNGK